MKTFLLAFAVSLLASALLTPLVRHFALRWGAVALAGERSVHAGVIPRLGGIALASAASLPLLFFLLLDSGAMNKIRPSGHLIIGLALGSVLMAGMGALDDLRGLSARYKLCTQVVAATLAFFFGFQIQAIELPFVGVLSMGVFAYPVTVFWIVGIVNALNLIDGLDGLAAGVAFFACITNFVVAVISNSVLVALLMSAMMGSLVGFLIYNFNPARIFMGDSGSYFLGFVLGCSALAGQNQKASTAISLLAPIIAMGVPLLDTSLTMIRRALERKPLFSPDRGHIHHRLLDLGLTHRRAVLLLYGVSIILCGAAIGIALGRRWAVGVAFIVAITTLFGLVRFVGALQWQQQLRANRLRIYDETAQFLRLELPAALARWSSLSSEPEVYEELFSLHQSGSFSEITLRSVEQKEVIADWQEQGAPNRRGPAVIIPLGPDFAATHQVEFYSRSGDPLSREAAILLQVFCDTAAARLFDLDSSLAPRTLRAPGEAAKNRS
ncbi:MAG: undecaprenyl/decaprenyl-phosphate alpha-N-acetylglucosaminyl 1-phosphate transferase [Polyangiaceae bacterium]|nr:undecaprenyl/decaprenyl-phosphate alpha-N-acetylglucosaminyl 1-phosphate transferase [Polyangiaceae bacterium]